MTVPVEYQRATDNFHDLLVDARNVAELETVNQAYTMAQGGIETFPRRLGLEDAIRLSNVLPAALRALFVAHCDAQSSRMRSTGSSGSSPRAPAGSGRPEASRALHTEAFSSGPEATV